jgi:ribonuclease Y
VVKGEKNLYLTMLIAIIILIIIITAIYSFKIIDQNKINKNKILKAQEKADEILSNAQEKLKIAEQELLNASLKSKEILNDADSKRKEIIINAKEDCLKLREEIDKESKNKSFELEVYEKKIFLREEALEKKRNQIYNKEEALEKKINETEKKRAEIDNIFFLKKQELERISQLTHQEAKQIILEKVRSECILDEIRIIRESEEKIKLESDRLALDVIKSSLERCDVSHIAETTVSSVVLPNDDLKGKIIGREGRNIRLLENLTGVDIIIDDTPEIIVLSCFDPIRRDTARIVLEKLISDGRINPTRIEELYLNSKKEIENIITTEGESTCYQTGVMNLNIELIKLLGKMKYRTSYGQNALRHSIEVSLLCGLMANELGIDSTLAKRAGLLHDIGKSIDHETEGSHVDIGVSLCKKYGESDLIINSVEAHHNAVEPKSVTAVMVKIADTLSAARIGARRETLETYIKRLEYLEKICNEFEGIKKSFVVHAGRELRIIVIPEKINDLELPILAKNISRRVESEVQYPGQIKISVIREIRAIEYAS